MISGALVGRARAGGVALPASSLSSITYWQSRQKSFPLSYAIASASNLGQYFGVAGFNFLRLF